MMNSSHSEKCQFEQTRVKRTVTLFKPDAADLSFRQALLADPKTMQYNQRYGGTIAFETNVWEEYGRRWLADENPKRFYRYLMSETGEPVGEISFHTVSSPEGERLMIDVIILAAKRHQGYGSQGLDLLEEEARQRGFVEIYDDLAIDNPALSLFLKRGYQIVDQDEEKITIVKKL